MRKVLSTCLLVSLLAANVAQAQATSEPTSENSIQQWETFIVDHGKQCGAGVITGGADIMIGLLNAGLSLRKLYDDSAYRSSTTSAIQTSINQLWNKPVSEMPSDVLSWIGSYTSELYTQVTQMPSTDQVKFACQVGLYAAIFRKMKGPASPPVMLK